MPVELMSAQRLRRLPLRTVQRWGEELLVACRRKKWTLSILLTNDSQIQQLHKRWMGQDSPTDVLSFPMGGQAKGAPLLLGDVAISVETVARQSPGKLPQRLLWVLIHGFLHLLGYDHATLRDQERMEKQARRLFRRILGDEAIL